MILLQTDTPPVNSTVEIIKAIGGVLGIIGGILTPLILFYINKMSAKMNTVADKVDGLLEEKTKADIKIGEKKVTDAMDKTKADIQTGVQQEKKEQAFRDQPSSQQKDEVIQVVEKKTEEIKEGVEEVPDKVVKKLPPK